MTVRCADLICLKRDPMWKCNISTAPLPENQWLSSNSIWTESKRLGIKSWLNVNFFFSLRPSTHHMNNHRFNFETFIVAHIFFYIIITRIEVGIIKLFIGFITGCLQNWNCIVLQVNKGLECSWISDDLFQISIGVVEGTSNCASKQELFNDLSVLYGTTWRKHLHQTAKQTCCTRPHQLPN